MKDEDSSFNHTFSVQYHQQPVIKLSTTWKNIARGEPQTQWKPRHIYIYIYMYIYTDTHVNPLELLEHASSIVSKHC